MNEVELAVRLRESLEVSGRTTWELSRRANVKLKLVEALLSGSGAVPLAVLIRVTEALELGVYLAPSPASMRSVGPISSVVDEAIELLRRD